MRGQNYGTLLVLITLVLALHCGGSNSNNSPGVAGLATQIETISNDFVPESLDYSSSSQSRLNPSSPRFASSGPCVGTDLFGCQPILLRIYIAINQLFAGQAVTTLDDVGSHMTDIADGTSGTVTEDTQTIEYSKTSDAEFSVLVKTNDGTPFAYLSLADSQFTMRLDIFAQPADTSGSGPTEGIFEISGTFTDENHWTVVSQMIGMNCQSDDVGAPQNIRVRMEKADGLWTGKAMMYLPRWAEDYTCDTTPTDSTGMVIYTDFVGDATAAKVSVFAMRPSITDLSSIDMNDYALNDLSANYPEVIQGADLSAYENPFCNPSSTDIAVWNDNCSGTSSAVSEASFGSATDWLDPSEFAALTLAIPTSL
ncbi:MAG: hypothetical protein V1798_05975 [Pseudomonadota bacterium]